MQLNTDTLKVIADAARELAVSMDQLAEDLDAAANDYISQGDVDLLALYAAYSFVNDQGPLLVRMG